MAHRLRGARARRRHLRPLRPHRSRKSSILDAITLALAIHAADAALRVVTHVEQVKERIPAHIDVEKRGDGRSVLSGPGVIAS
jgi:hypothetical protein